MIGNARAVRLCVLTKKAETKAVKKKVPKGTSDYQAAWIVDSEEEEEEEDEDDEDDEEVNIFAR